MGAIMAIERDGVVYLGADAVRCINGVNYYMNNESNLKLHRMPSGIIIAGNGVSAIVQQMVLHDEWFELAEGEKFDKRFIVTKIISRFEKAVNREEWKCTNYDVHNVDAGFIIAKGAEIYTVLGDLSVTKCDGVASLSCNDADVMMTAYALLHEDTDPEAVIKRAFELAATRCKDIYTHGYVINTRDFTFKRMEDIVC
jgi:hypothetical protein